MTVNIQSNVGLSWKLCDLSPVIDHDRCSRIYLDFFNLNGAPFSITPDPEFLFLSDTHRSVFEKILYSLQTHMGFMLLTGEVGTGKTTLCRALLDNLHDSVQTVYVINPSLSGYELLAGILDDLGISYSRDCSKKDLIDRLNRFLLADQSGRPVVIVVDDAQTMPLATLEDLRLLSNLETDKTKLLQIVLAGQPELLDLLDQPQIRQLKQRVAIHCSLDYLTRDEVRGYIERRLFIAGNRGQVRFTHKVVRQIHKKSGGVPRMINKICDLALTAAYAADSNIVDSIHFKAACSELIEHQDCRKSNLKGLGMRYRTVLIAAAAFAAAFLLEFGLHDNLQRQLFSSQISQPQSEVSPAIGSQSLEQNKSQETATSQNPTPLTAADEIRAYILQLGSFNTLATTLRAVDYYSQKGVEAHWSMVDLGEKGLWYRVFAGRYASIEAARDYQNRAELVDAQILHAPWVVVIGPTGSTASISAARRNLQARGVDSYSLPQHEGLQQLYSGAFVSQGRAEELARQINLQTGMATRVTSFQPALVSNKSTISKTNAGDQS